MPSVTPERLYKIKDNRSYFHSGRIKNGNQVLMGLQMPNMVMVEFDSKGTYLQKQTRAVSEEQDSDENQLAIQLQGWQSEIRFTSATISVKEFFLADSWIGIKSLPDHYQQFLNNSEEYSVERRTELRDDIHSWESSGDFVFYWDEEYYLNQEGEVESS